MHHHSRISLLFLLPGTVAQADQQGIVVLQTRLYADADSTARQIGKSPAGFTVRIFERRGDNDPYAFLDSLTSIDSINPDSAELTLSMNTHPATTERLQTLVGKVDSRLDSYVRGVDNAARFRSIAVKQ